MERRAEQRPDQALPKKPLESSRSTLNRFRLLIYSTVLGVGVIAAACDGGQENPFEFTIPREIQTFDDALAYAKQQIEVRSDEIQIAFGGGGDPDKEEVQNRDVRALVLAETGEEYLRIQERWTENLQVLFNRWDICEADIAWNIPSGTFEDLGLDPKQAVQTPGCEIE
ncbi:MAG: hypothetical protein A2172_03945 [Candidatus Woykebacteria bacterium RBG_13_40_15]|uniref:Uncharacterized protein n=1 Tax=Candidatus Woykebacteria bacterium RBG_13_40_15 TaxID=1802593 RepID=A0A1G1W547_9BACT|nr:MAG: hypothetical protein A2172_03945 [Candidatus Woykebacteria bacterium RBG_13_40_15]